MSSLKAFILFLALCVFSWFEFAQPLTARAIGRQVEDAFDSRPTRTVLILGNSRTFYHNMPDMIRSMADSAHDPEKLEITLDAPPGGSFEMLWKDAGTQALVGRQWDNIVLQGESRGQSTNDLASSFQTYGVKLIGEAHPLDGHTRLIINWPYASSLWSDGDPDGSERMAFAGEIESSTAALGERTGARLLDVAKLWLSVERDNRGIALTEDGNHPTLAGSYLFALALYGDLTGRDIGAVTYVPSDLDPAVAAKLRVNAQAFQAPV